MLAGSIALACARDASNSLFDQVDAGIATMRNRVEVLVSDTSRNATALANLSRQLAELEAKASIGQTIPPVDARPEVPRISILVSA